jgi:hypothetical protein
MLPAGFEPTIPANERPQTAPATGIGIRSVIGGGDGLSFEIETLVFLIKLEQNE